MSGQHGSQRLHPWAPLIYPVVLVILHWRRLVASVMHLEFWIMAGLMLLVMGLLAAVGLAYWRFSVWFDESVERARGRIARRAAIYHGEAIPSYPDAMRDRELDG